jgi:hypothetical protein
MATPAIGAAKTLVGSAKTANGLQTEKTEDQRFGR